MFATLKKKNDYGDAASMLYAQLVAQVRRPEFYAACGVPDTFIGRFDLLLLHVFMVINRMEAEGAAGRAFSQALFDATFANMDQGLRELGIGDMGVPKRMRKMMRAFNGRMHAYHQGLASDLALLDAIRRNLYGTVPGIAGDRVARMAEYVRANINVLSNITLTDFCEGRMVLRVIKQD